MIDIEQVKAYNAELKSKKEKANRLMTRIEMYEKELDSKCAELSKELGITVTRENLKQVYSDYEENLKRTLETGRAVLQKISQAEMTNSAASTNGNVNAANMNGMQYGANQQMGQVGVTGYGAPIQNNAQVQNGMAMQNGMNIQNTTMFQL